MSVKVMDELESVHVHVRNRTWNPVLRRTQLRRGNVSGASAGRIEDPPVDFGTLPRQSTGSDFVWFKTADRSVRAGKHGKWQRIEEWTGFDTVDTDLYPGT